MADITPSSFRIAPAPTSILIQTTYPTPFLHEYDFAQRGRGHRPMGWCHVTLYPSPLAHHRGVLGAGVSSAVLCILKIFSGVCFPNTTTRPHTPCTYRPAGLIARAEVVWCVCRYEHRSCGHTWVWRLYVSCNIYPCGHSFVCVHVHVNVMGGP